MFSSDRRRLLLGAVLLGLVPPGQICQAQAPAAAATPPERTARYELDSLPLDRIEPGTVISEKPPKGWTHLIVHSVPRLTKADRAAVHSLVAKLATLLSTNLAARVVRDETATPPHYYLAAVGLGLGAEVANHHVVVSSQSTDSEDPGLGIVANLFLAQMERQFESRKFAIRSRGLAVFDFLGVRRVGDRHEPVTLRYAVLVDHQSGRLETLLWLIEEGAEGGPRLLAPDCHWLERNLVEDCVLHVDPDEFTAGIPTNKAFAIVAWPPGRKLPLGDSLASLALSPRFTQESAAALEVALRHLLAEAIRRAAGSGAPTSAEPLTDGQP